MSAVCLVIHDDNFVLASPLMGWKCGCDSLRCVGRSWRERGGEERDTWGL